LQFLFFGRIAESQECGSAGVFVLHRFEAEDRTQEKTSRHDLTDRRIGFSRHAFQAAEINSVAAKDRDYEALLSTFSLK